MILSTNPEVRAVAEALHRQGNGCRRDIDGMPICEAITPDPHEQHAREYVESGAHYMEKCLIHWDYEPCRTCSSYIAAGL